LSDPPGIRIESATESDIPTILRLVRALADYERMPGAVTATEQDLRERLFGQRPAAEAVLAYAAGEPIGVAVYFQTFSTFVGRPGIYLEDIFVQESWRGRGAGQALMQHVARVATERGCARFEWAVLNWNEPAIGFYTSLGAKPHHEWTVYRLSGVSLAQLAAEAPHDPER
jgi:GNAT superfamily N-acetyltransferase